MLNKRGIHIDIPGFSSLHLKAMCSDYTGTFSYNGELISGVSERIRELSERIDIHIVTSDTRKTAREQLRGHKLREKHRSFHGDLSLTSANGSGISWRDDVRQIRHHHSP